MRTNSVCMPSMIQPPVTQREYRPLWQWTHLPHALMQEISTRSPGLNDATAGPARSTMPMPSWPGIRPGQRGLPSRSGGAVPQIAGLVTLTITSVGSVISGLERAWEGALAGTKSVSIADILVVVNALPEQPVAAPAR